MRKRINIFVVCHKPAYVLENRLLIPIQVGAALNTERYKGMLQDDTGENISARNQQYCELTAQYWAWKNVDSDYYGFFHYRRYMSFETIYPVGVSGKIREGGYIRPYVELNCIQDDLSKYKLEETWMEQQISQYELLTILRERINTSVHRQFCQYHSKEDMDLLLEILIKSYPEYKEAAKSYMNSKEIYYMNMYIMKKPLFMNYMEWLFKILEEFELKKKETSQTEIQPRLMGYLGERLFGIFYTYQRQRGVKCAEVPYLKFYDTGCGEKKDIQYNIRSFQLKPTKYEIRIDMRKLNRLFPPGSRRRILLRNLFLR